MEPNYFITTLIVVVAAIPIALFIFFYGSKPKPGRSYHWWNRKPSSRWRSTKEGETIMLQKVAWLAFLIFAIANRFFGEWPGRDIVAFIIYAALVFLFWRFLWRLRVTQKETSENPQNPNLEDTNPRHPRNQRRR